MVGLSSIFGGSSPNEPVGSTESSANLAAKAQLKKELEVELATANLTELVSKLSETCFEVCPTSDDLCVSQCVQKYMQSWNVISQTYLGVIQKAKN